MLRRKLLLVLGSLVVLLLVSALSAILLLHDVLRDLTYACNAAVTAAAQTRLAEQSITVVEAELTRLQEEPASRPESVIEAATALEQHIAGLVGSGTLPAEAADFSRRLRQQLPDLDEHLATYTAASDPVLKDEALLLALETAAALRADISELNRLTYENSAREHEQLITKFRGAAIVLGIGF
ncbi:MAG: hypothetical protein ACYSU2_13620, partial [Planctomycetota bacterium]